MPLHALPQVLPLSYVLTLPDFLKVSGCRPYNSIISNSLDFVNRFLLSLVGVPVNRWATASAWVGFLLAVGCGL